MIVSRLELVDFRNYREVCFEFDPGITAVVGLNGQGKTNLTEAMAYLSTLSSFRGAPDDALIRVGASAAIVRATVRDDDGREQLIELELSRNGRNRVQVNKQRLQRSRDLLGVMRVTVFAPDDLSIVKEGPQERRRYMDDVLVALAVKYDALRLELDRIVKQRNVLLKQAGGKLTDEVELTLDVWDAKFAQLADQFGHARAVLVARLSPLVADAYNDLADRSTPIELRYEPTWRQRGMAAALVAARSDDLRRGSSSVGPHRDDVDLFINGLPARTHASQGEQRTLALALRLAAHRLVAERVDSVPVLVLDDVLSELDGLRCAALLRHLPVGQVVLTTAGQLPEAAHPDATLTIAHGTVVGMSAPNDTVVAHDTGVSRGDG
jgi:DNA replication and repair protein RecF